MGCEIDITFITVLLFLPYVVDNVMIPYKVCK